MTDGPVQNYRALTDGGEIAHDPAQERAVRHLQRLYDAIAGWRPGQKTGRLRFLGLGQPVSPPEGIYLWGDVGRGKSMLMDMFFETAPVARKRRVHFHAFMAETHERIFAWRQREKSGQVKGDDPIVPVASDIAKEATLLCFDEFQVTDVTDAMILGRLMGALFEQGVLIVLTSNRIPDDLYKDGLNRGLFLPTIELLKEKLNVEALDGPTDYRLERMKGVKVYHYPLGDDATEALSDAFWRLTDHAVNDRSEVGPEELTIQGRILTVPVASRGVAVVSFKKICAAALGAADYLALAWKYHTIIMVGIPQLGPENRNEAKRFVTFIDALYENNVKFLCCAEVAPEDLYAEGHGHFEFQRTVSRLMEMQSKEYLAKGHAV